MKKYLVGGVFSLCFLIIQAVTSQWYGMNWDSPFRFMRGQTYLQMFLTGKGSFGIHRDLSPIIFHANERVSRFDYLDGEGDNNVLLPDRPLFMQDFAKAQQKAGHTISFYQDDYYSWDYFKKNDAGHPPFPDIMAALSNRIFYQTLHLSDDVHSYQLADSFFGAMGIFVIFVFAYELLVYLGLSRLPVWLGAGMAAIALGSYPLFFGDSHFNMKEPLVASAYLGAIWTFWKWFMTGKKRWFAGFVAFLAVSFGTKWNIVLLPAVLLPWVFVQLRTKEFKKWFHWRLVLFAVILAVACAGFVVAIWPWTWSDPIGKLVQTYYYYKTFAFQPDGNNQPIGFISLYGINLYPMYLIFIESQEMLLALVLVGLVFLSFRSRRIGLLLFLWFFIPVAKMMWPGVWFYNGIRQEIEAIPALAILGGIGTAVLLQGVFKLPFGFVQGKQFSIFKAKKVKVIISLLLCLAIAAVLIYPIIRLFPNENLYFNSFVGGEKGAFQRNLINQKKNYGNVYKQAADWINLHAPKNAKVAILSGNQFALSPTFFRPDISLSPYNFSGLSQKGEYVMETYWPNPDTIFAYKYLYRFLDESYTVYADGAPILKIFHNVPRRLDTDMRGEQSTTTFLKKEITISEGKTIAIDLGAIEHITRIYVSNAPEICQKIAFKFGDEAISFYSQPGIRNSVYVFNEKTVLPDNIVMYSFPATPARVITITPVNEHSCFTTGTVTKVSFLP